MPALTVNGVDIPVTPDSSEDEPLVVGDRFNAFAGNLRLSETARVRKFSFVTNRMDPTQYATVYAALATFGPLACSGDALPASVTSCAITLQGGPFGNDGAEIDRVIRFQLEAVSP